MHPPHSQMTEEFQVVRVPICDRWQVQRRLQELSVPAQCSDDGYLYVEVNTHVEAAQIWSVVRQFCTPRSTLVDWLERCWQQRPIRPAYEEG